MNLEDLVKHIIWIALFFVALAGIYFLFRRLEIL